MQSGRFNRAFASLVCVALLTGACAGTSERAARSEDTSSVAVAERPATAARTSSRPIVDASLPIYNLAWVVPGALMRSGAVMVGGGTRLAAADATDAPEVLKAYQVLQSRYKVSSVVNLRAESSEDAAAAKACGMTYLHMPIPDGVAPSPDEVRRFFAFVDAEKAQGHVVLWHCAGGIGRTGVLAAIQRLREGWTQQAAAQEMFDMGLSQAQAIEHLPALAAFAKAAGKATWFPADWSTPKDCPHDYSQIAQALVR